jgi:2'-5' RNA ligase
MSSPTSVGGDDRIRLFLGLRLPEPALDAVEAWQRERLERMRLVPRAQLHVTLAFLGHRPAAELPGVAMLVCGDDSGRAGLLAADLQGRLERLGVFRREARPWLPHLTVGRFRERPGLSPKLANMGTYVLIPSDASAFLSRLRPSGAEYEVLASVALGGR